MNDLKNAIRTLRTTPVVSLIAVLSLGLGIGANTAIGAILVLVLVATVASVAPAWRASRTDPAAVLKDG